LIARARAGEEIVIARGDLPVARLEPPQVRRDARGRARVGKAFFEPLSPEELEAWGQ
jgi:antitoxin (DNA-binding transcriptional repressor) of toxin-antitoxin stability system